MNNKYGPRGLNEFDKVIAKSVGTISRTGYQNPPRGPDSWVYQTLLKQPLRAIATVREGQ